MGAMGASANDAGQREPLEPGGPSREKIPRRANGASLFRRRRRRRGWIRATEGLMTSTSAGAVGLSPVPEIHDSPGHSRREGQEFGSSPSTTILASRLSFNHPIGAHEDRLRHVN